MTLPVAILAGGLATRLRPITEKIPKALVEVAGRPFISRQLEYLRDQGITKVVMCTGYLGKMIEDVVGDGAQFGLSVNYSPDGPVLLGTGGALRQAAEVLGDAFFVLYGDSFLPIDFGAVEESFRQNAKPALMTVLRNGNRWDKSNVLFRDGTLVEYNKSEPRADFDYIDYGLGILSRTALAGYPEGIPFDLAEVYHKLSVSGDLQGFEVFERFYEIGSHDGLKETSAFFSGGNN